MGLDDYLDRIGRYRLLDAGEERALSARIAAGRTSDDPIVVADGRRAWRQLYLANLRLVVALARSYPADTGLDIDDLVQAGNIGLGLAVDRFDGRKGFRFSTYATDRIRQAIGRAIDGTSTTIRLPSDLMSSLRSDLRHAGGDPAGVRAALRPLLPLARSASLDAPLPSGADLGSLVVDAGPSVEDAVLARNRRDAIHRVVGALPPDGRRAVVLRFGLDGGPERSLAEVASSIGRRPGDIPHLLRRSLAALRVELSTI